MCARPVKEPVRTLRLRPRECFLLVPPADHASYIVHAHYKRPSRTAGSDQKAAALRQAGASPSPYLLLSLD